MISPYLLVKPSFLTNQQLGNSFASPCCNPGYSWTTPTFLTKIIKFIITIHDSWDEAAINSSQIHCTRYKSFTDPQVTLW